jgi:hypothetical protein
MNGQFYWTEDELYNVQRCKKVKCINDKNQAQLFPQAVDIDTGKKFNPKITFLKVKK